MIRKRNIGTMAALGGLTAAIALLTGLPSASADELADLRANQELLQRRVDQLAQAGPATGPGPGGPVLSGSFPRSFVVPGSEVSLRIGGQGVGSVVWYMKGSAVGGGLGGQGGFNETYVDGQGGTGNLPGIPLNTHSFSNTAAPTGFAHSRSSEWDFSGKQTRFFLDARAPMARSRAISRWISRPRTPTRSSTTTPASLTATSRACAKAMRPWAGC